MQDLERVEERLDNIRSVKPILGALRMIALGSWQAALKRRQGVQQYGAELLEVLPALLPHVDAGRSGLWARFRNLRSRPTASDPDAVPRRLVLVIGSERGLCGRFNTAVSEFAQEHLQHAPAMEVHLLGRRLTRIWMQAQRPLTGSAPMPFTAIPTFDMAHAMTTRWLTRYEAHALDTVDVIYNRYRGAGLYAPGVWRMLPPALPDLLTNGTWPPTIIETDPLALYTQVVQQWAATAFFGVLLESASSEHAARYQLMESATQNAERLIDELTDAVQAARQQAITREMQELAAGAGLIGATE